MSAKKTPLYDKHQELGGKVVDYAGFLLPVEYVGLKEEHRAVREAVGLFDVSHMGEVYVKGKEALDYLNYTLSNDFSKIKDHQIAYSFILNDEGGIIDDLLVYKFNDEFFLLVPNAANTEKDVKHLEQYVKDFDITFENKSSEFGQLAIQGPKAEEVLQKVVDVDLSEIKYYWFNPDAKFENYDLIVSRTGYTGEDGFEVYGNPEAIVALWDKLLEVGKDEGIQPAGLGCRDTLRFEAGLPLYGNEMSDTINPLEVGLGFALKLNKEGDFIGKAATQKLKDEGLKRELIGIELLKKRPARQGATIELDGEVIGEVTTGYLSPTVGKSIANALVTKGKVEEGDEVDVVIRNKPSKAKVVSRKFLK